MVTCSENRNDVKGHVYFQDTFGVLRQNGSIFAFNNFCRGSYPCDATRLFLYHQRGFSTNVHTLYGFLSIYKCLRIEMNGKTVAKRQVALLVQWHGMVGI